MIVSDIEFLQNWYAQHCNGDWEHQYGVSIETLDNPGWRVKINLVGTELEKAPFEEIKVGIDHDDDWYFLSIKEDPDVSGPVFDAACSPQYLKTVIEIFKNFVEKGA